MERILQKHRQTSRANAVYYLLCGLLCAAGAVAAHFYLPLPFLIWFTTGCSIIFLGTSGWFANLDRNHRGD